MNGYRKMMMDNGENLSWCKPLAFLGGKIILAVNEGEIVGMRIDGADVKINAENILRVAKAVNPDYDLYSGWDDLHIITEAPHEELGCCNCPWFDICDAMDNPDGWENAAFPDDDDDDEAQSSEPMTADLMVAMVLDWMADNGYEDSDDYSEDNDKALHVEWESAKFDEDLNSWVMYAKDNKGVWYTLTEFNGNIYLNA